MIIIIAIIILIVLASLDSRDKEALKKPFIIGYRPGTGEPVFNKVSEIKPIRYDIHTGRPIFEDDEEVPVVQPKVLTEEDKTKKTNSILMITGAILIVFASIIFLATSWDILNGIIKTLILVVIQVVFILFSIICDKTFNIPKTSKIFKYLSLLFVPIVLLSLSCFRLLTDFLNINGAGFFLYFGLTFLITDVVYKMFNVLENDKVISILSYICAVTGLFYVIMYYFPTNELVLLFLSLHSLVYYVLMEYNIIKKDYLVVNNVFNYIIVFVAIIAINLGMHNFILGGTLIVNAIYYFIKYLRNNDDLSQRRYIVYLVGLYTLSLTSLKIIDIPPYFIYNLALIPLVPFVTQRKKDKIKKVFTNSILIMSILITIRSIISAIYGYFSVPGPFLYDQRPFEIYHVLSFASAFILYILIYLFSKNGLAKILSYSAFTIMFMEIFKMAELQELNKYILLVTIVLVYFLEVLFEKLKDNYSDFYIPALIMIESVVLIDNYAVLVPLLFMIIYIYLEHKSENLLLLPMLTSLSIFTMKDTTTAYFINYALVSIYTVLSLLKKQFNVYTAISFTSLILANLVCEMDIITSSFLLVVLSLIHLLFNQEQKIFKFATATSIFILYLCFLIDIRIQVSFVAPYIFGMYIYLLTLTRYVWKGNAKEVAPLEVIGLVFITLIGLSGIGDPIDAVLIIFGLLLISIIGFLMRWNHITYAGLGCLVVNILLQTAEYWSQIPWYVYILLIGLALIILAMLDEKRKLNKKNNENEQVKEVDTK